MIEFKSCIHIDEADGVQIGIWAWGTAVRSYRIKKKVGSKVLGRVVKKTLMISFK